MGLINNTIIVFYTYYCTGVILPSPETELRKYFYAIITVESNWYVKAKSHTGDIGLAQINPRGALAEYNLYHKPKVNVQELYNREINMKVGEWYFAHLLKTFNGDFDKAIAAYNAGPNRVREGMLNSKYVRKVKRAKDRDDRPPFRGR